MDRDARGEWRPSYPAAYAPISVRPFDPRAIARWIVGWPGYLWPVNGGLLLIAVVTWRYTEPALTRCRSFNWDWMLQIWLRNLALVWLVYGGAFAIMYLIKIDGLKGKYTSQWPARNKARFLFRNQVHDNIFWTAGVAVLIWSAYEIATMWLYANHRLPYFAPSEHPVATVLWIIAIPVWREFHFYWIHRFLHWKRIYPSIHYLHHKNIDVNPWSGMAMHPIETTLYLSVALIHWIIPSNPFLFFFTLQHAALGPVSGHLGFEGPVMKGKLPIGSYFHYLHHRHFECNYGESMLPLDRWFGTYRDGLMGDRATKRRRQTGA